MLFPMQSGGSAIIYQIEARWRADQLLHPGQWFTPPLHPADFGERRAALGEDAVTVCPVYREYSPAGACWQLTGQIGFMDLAVANLGFARVMKHAATANLNGGWAGQVDAFRLVKRAVAVQVEVLQIWVPDPAAAAKPLNPPEKVLENLLALKAELMEKYPVGSRGEGANIAMKINSCLYRDYPVSRRST